MDIYTTTKDESSFADMFGEDYKGVIPDNYRQIKADLVIFTGGSDVYPEHYGLTKFPRGVFNEKRDKYELRVIKDIRTGRFGVRKVLGICRGLQILNVAFGGTLVFDIATKFGTGHMSTHSILWSTPNPFSEFLSTVNSVHHQCLDNIASSYRYTILGIEPYTKTVEAIIWENMFLGFQFHPEWFGDKILRDKCTKVIKSWVKGEINLFSIESARKQRTYNYQSISDSVTYTPPQIHWQEILPNQEEE